MTLPEVAPEPPRDALQRAFGRAAGSAVSSGNQVDLLIDGAATYAAMLAQIESAQHRVHLENYIIRDDRIGGVFADRLIERARSGVRVRLMYDWIGSFATPARFWRRLRDAGVEVRAFGPLRMADPLMVFARDHRKTLIVDGEFAVAGGLCIGDEWVGDPIRSRQPWRDTAVAIHGPAARQVDDAFCRAWTFNGGSLFPPTAKLGPAPDPRVDSDVRVVATEPGRERGFRTIDLLLGVTASRIWVTEAYLSAPQRLYEAFKDAARDGVDVRLLLPGSSDIRAVRNLSRVGYRGLLRAGVRIWEWGGPMLHAKTIVADGRWVRIGSSNLNPSSLLANWEIDLFVYGERLARADGGRSFSPTWRSRAKCCSSPGGSPTVMGREVFRRACRDRPAGAPRGRAHAAVRSASGASGRSCCWGACCKGRGRRFSAPWR